MKNIVSTFFKHFLNWIFQNFWRETSLKSQYKVLVRKLECNEKRNGSRWGPERVVGEGWGGVYNDRDLAQVRHSPFICARFTIMADGVTEESELQCGGGGGALCGEIILWSMYSKFLKANFKQILRRKISWKYIVKLFLKLEIIWGKRDSKILRIFVFILKFWRNWQMFENFEEI